MHNLFCQTGDCDAIALDGEPTIGYWCPRHYRELKSLLAQKLASGRELTEDQWYVWCVMQEQAIAERQHA